MKNKKYLNLLVLLVAIILLNCAVSISNVYADSSDLKLKDLLQFDNYSVDTILITLKSNKESIKKVYTAQDFKNFNCIEVEDLTAMTNNAINDTLQRKLNGETLSVKQKMIAKKATAFKRILKLKLDVESKQELFEIIQKISERNDVEAVSLDYYLEEFATYPNDTYYTNNNQWAINKISLPQAWDIETGDSSVLVGVIDTGIENSHVDLGNNLASMYHRQYQNGWMTDASPNDVSSASHGTGVAGVIGAEVNNGKGVSGVCWDVSMVSYRVGGSWSGVNSSIVAQAIDYAAIDYVPILNISAGWYADNAYYNSSLRK